MANSFYDDRINNLVAFKNNEYPSAKRIDVMKVRGKEVEYKHFLTGEFNKSNFLFNDVNIKINPKSKKENILNFPSGIYNDISLHAFWHHMNSSQVMCINFFYKYLKEPEKLSEILKQIEGINIEQDIKPKSIEFEHKEDDKSSIDLVIELNNNKKIFIEVKYTESAFGGTQSKRFKELHDKYHSNVEINDDYSDYKKYYQFIRNACLGIDGNYTIFLFPKNNISIAESYRKAKENIKFIKPVEVGCLYWEDIIKKDIDDIFYRKYFANALEMEEYYKNKS